MSGEYKELGRIIRSNFSLVYKKVADTLTANK